MSGQRARQRASVISAQGLAALQPFLLLRDNVAKPEGLAFMGRREMHIAYCYQNVGCDGDFRWEEVAMNPFSNSKQDNGLRHVYLKSSAHRRWGITLTERSLEVRICMQL